MANLLTFGVLTLFFSSAPIQGSPCRNLQVKEDDSYQYVQATILSLSEAESAVASHKASSKKPKTFAESLTGTADAMFRLKEDHQSYSCAASMLEGYTTSHNADIRENAIKAHDTYLNLMDLTDQLLDMIEKTLRALDGSGAQTPSAVQMEDLQVKMQQLWEVLGQTATHSLTAITASKPGDAEKRLRITLAERNQLLKMLESEFGKGIRQAWYQQPNVALTTASEIYHTLALDSWKFRPR